MINEEEIRKLEKQITDALGYYTEHAPSNGIENVSHAFIENLASDNAVAKSALRELFRKSPVWNEELDALVINGTRTHDADPKRVRTMAAQILKAMPYDSIVEAFMNCCVYSEPGSTLYGDEGDGYFTSEAYLETVAPGAYHPGKKPSRVFKAICDAKGITDNAKNSSFQRMYAQLADELSAKKIDFKLFVTPGPGYFLTMSNPKYDDRGATLTSCHSLNSDDYTYNGGCSGYARDETSFLVFTAADPSDVESLFNRKTTRQVFAYKPGGGVLLQSRLYNTNGGTEGAQHESAVYRDLIQREISELEGAINLWSTSASSDSDLIRMGCGFGGYPDWTYSSFDGKVSVRQDVKILPQYIVVGAPGLCFECGCTTDDDEGRFCRDCRCVAKCDWCDEIYDEDDLHVAYDNRGREVMVCEHCLQDDFIWCGECESYQHIDNARWVDAIGEYVCDNCIDEYYSWCEDCGSYHLNDDGRYVESVYRFVCNDCIETRYMECDRCGEWVPDSGVEFRGECLCDCCYEEHVTVCEECGQIVWKDDTVEQNGKTVCKECVERTETESVA